MPPSRPSRGIKIRAHPWLKPVLCALGVLAVKNPSGRVKITVTFWCQRPRFFSLSALGENGRGEVANAKPPVNQAFSKKKSVSIREIRVKIGI